MNAHTQFEPGTAEEVTTVNVVELGIDADQQKAGIAEAVEITWRGFTIIVAETDGGLYCYGTSSHRIDRPPAPFFARAACWQRLLSSLPRVIANAAGRGR